MNSRHYSEEVKTIKAIKKIIPIIIAFFMLSVMVIPVSAQVTATATGTASIITPISIAATANLNFGNVAVSSSLGTVVLAPLGTRSLNGGVTLPAVAGPFSPATFTVSGTGSSTYSIILPSSCEISDGASHSMTISDFKSYPSGAGILSPDGTQTIKVGATLIVVGSQAPGNYTNVTGFPVIVNYN